MHLAPMVKSTMTRSEQLPVREYVRQVLASATSPLWEGRDYPQEVSEALHKFPGPSDTFGEVSGTLRVFLSIVHS